MITELNVIAPEIVAGAKIDVVEHRIRNFRLHGLLENLSRLLIAVLEVQSNDSSSTVVPSDVRDIQSQFGIIVEDLEFAILVNDAPIGSYQHAFVVAIIDQKEVQRIRNIKVKNVVKDLWMLGMVVLGSDSAKTQNFISPNDQAKVKRALEVCSLSMKRWIGTGENEDSLGIFAPAFEQTGVVTPDVDSNFAVKLEPSKHIPKPQLDDVADV